MGRITCDANDWSRQSQLGQRPLCHTCLTPGQAIGLAFSAYTGATSFVSVLVLFTVVLVRFYYASPVRRANLLSYLDIFLVNLFTAEALMSFGGLQDAKWANEGQVYCGNFCHSQGTLLFLGETAVSIWTFVITVYTWICVARARRFNFQPLVCLGIMGAVWGYVFGFHFGSQSMSPRDDEDPRNYITPTPFWCWVNPAFTNQRLAQYVWLWIAGIGNIAVYGSLYFLLRGNLVLGDNSILSVRWHWTPVLRNEGDEEEEKIRKDAFKLLWYPIAYTILVLPLSVVRWMGTGNRRYADPQLPDMASLATAQLTFHALYRLSAVVNVVLVLATRPSVLLLDRATNPAEGEEGGSKSNSNSNVDIAIPLAYRSNATHPEEERRNTQFGVPPVDLGRDIE